MEKIGRTIKRRRREGKTDYKARLALLKSEKLRIVIRKTNRCLIVQLVESDIAQDKILFGVSSKELLNYGWPKEKEGSLKSLGAAYLTGFLLAKKAGKKKAILDIGLQRNVHRGRIYASLRGIIEGGIDIPADKDCLPTDEQLKDIDLITKVKEKINNG